jgi:hypothetical protein
MRVSCRTAVRSRLHGDGSTRIESLSLEHATHDAGASVKFRLEGRVQEGNCDFQSQPDGSYQ